MPFEFPTRDYHPATVERSSQKRRRKASIPQVKLPKDKNTLDVEIDNKIVRLTNLNKLFWPKLGVTKRDLIQYYLDVAPVLLPHIIDRAMVMKRYPHGAAGEFFFMKRAPTPRPDWIEICAIEHESGNVIDFPLIQDLPAPPLGQHPRLHPPHPVLRALRRRGPPRLRALRPRPRKGAKAGAVRARAG